MTIDYGGAEPHDNVPRSWHPPEINKPSEPGLPLPPTVAVLWWFIAGYLWGVARGAGGATAVETVSSAASSAARCFDAVPCRAHGCTFLKTLP